VSCFSDTSRLWCDENEARRELRSILLRFRKITVQLGFHENDAIEQFLHNSVLVVIKCFSDGDQLRLRISIHLSLCFLS
jgi:hypothetical protein